MAGKGGDGRAWPIGGIQPGCDRGDVVDKVCVSTGGEADMRVGGFDLSVVKSRTAGARSQHAVTEDGGYGSRDAAKSLRQGKAHRL